MSANEERQYTEQAQEDKEGIMARPDKPGEELRRLKEEFDGGRKVALWEAVIFCEQARTLKPDWLGKALGKFARDRLDPRKRGGRPNKKLQDIGIRAIVNYIREHQRGVFGKKDRDGNIQPPGPRAKPKRLPLGEAYKQASEMISKDVTDEEVRKISRILAGTDLMPESLETKGKELSASAIERIDKRARKKSRKFIPLTLPSKK